jgi:hypothetical protein
MFVPGKFFSVRKPSCQSIDRTKLLPWTNALAYFCPSARAEKKTLTNVDTRRLVQDALERLVVTSRGAKTFGIKTLNIKSVSIRHQLDAYADCRYADCRCAECLGVIDRNFVYVKASRLARSLFPKCHSSIYYFFY